ncbi:MAG: SGNH/GDSL hydrolase family protein [Planctomycetia bacterium]|nr:SGNH/GDSL hydrolase family protein [Planctomycetia bacterium]
MNNHQQISLCFPTRASNWARVVSFFIAMSAVIALAAPASAAEPVVPEDFFLRDGQTVVFLGDDLTHAGQYIEYLDAYLFTRFPDAHFHLLNRGVPGETVSTSAVSNSVDVGANPADQGPPHLAARFERTIGALNPQVIVACYGMSDGRFRSPDANLVQKYQAGVRRLIDRVRKETDARLVLLTPPPYDNRSRRGQPRPAGEPTLLHPDDDFDLTLTMFSDWLLSAPLRNSLRRLAPAAAKPDGDDDGADAAPAAAGDLVIDLHTPLKDHLTALRKSDAAARLSADGTHVEATGQGLIAQEILAAWNAPTRVAAVKIDAAKLTAVKLEAQATAPVASPDVTRIMPFDPSLGGVKFTWRTKLPMPLDPTWDKRSVALSRVNDLLNDFTLRVVGLPPGRYDLIADGRRVGAATDEQLLEGIDMTRLTEFPPVRDSTLLLPLVVRRQLLLRQLWIKNDPHPALAAERELLKNVAVTPQQIDELEKQIRQLCQPRIVRIRVVPNGGAPQVTGAPTTGQPQNDPPPPKKSSKKKALATSVDPDWQRDASPDMGLVGHRANQTSRRNAGSAAMLTGPTLIYEVYVSDRSSSWPDDRKQEIRRRVDDAMGFIVRNGLKYQQRVEIGREFGRPVKLDEEISKDPQADSAWTDRVIKLASGVEPAKLIEQLRKDRSVTNVLLMLHINKPGRSYNISFYRGVPADLASERLVLFTHFNRRQQTPAATYAHEVLHGFGAGDLYFPFDQSDDRYLRAKRQFPNDVMFRIDDKIDRLEIDEWTAYRVGWLPTLKPALKFLEDPR